MSERNLFESVKQNLNGRPGQPIVLGVCQALAARCGMEPWVFRAAAIILGLFFTIATLAGYVLLGWFLPETEERTRGVIRGLGIWLEEWIDRLAALGRDLFQGPGQRNGNSG